MISGGVQAIEARWNGGEWTEIGETDEDGAFTGTLTAQPEGQGTLEVRRAASPTQTVSAEYVGVGDVFIVAGQSNASGRGTNNQTYSHATLKAGLFRNSYQWGELSDPYDSATDQVDTVSVGSDLTAAAGSFVPLLATELMAEIGLPVAFVPCATGGVAITQWLPGADHQDRTTLYGSMVYRALQTGAKCVLWWQGESEALSGMSQATYNGHLDTIANAVMADLGIPLMAFKLQDCAGADVTTVNAAITEAWADNPNVLEGPDLSDIETDDDYHLKTDAKLLTVAQRTAAALVAAFYT